MTTSVTSTMSSTTVITPTPTWTYFTITQTQSQIPEPQVVDTVNNLYQQSVLDEEQRLLMERLRSLTQPTPVIPDLANVTPVRAEVVEIPRALNNIEALQKYVEGIRQLKKQQTETVVAEPVTETVSTVYMSGSKPGEFTTSLITISVESRRKRDIQPSSPALVQMSAVYHGDSSDNDDNLGYLEVDIEGSIE